MEQPDISNASSDLTKEEKDLENTGSDFLVSKQLLGDLDFENGFGSKDVTSRCYKPVEELWLVESSDIFHVDRQAHYSISLTSEDNISDDLILNTRDFQYDTVQHRNMADGQRASMSTGAEGRVHGGSLIALLAAGSESNDGSSNRGNVVAMPP
ncbi:Nucleic acid-binding, OB-fold [Artemisia annua]|uniref:Nucleic acid-binding, OB-fold n=1 Tax=Artemisia annua TaxID=35608 RepID=A0A2U1L5F4_ARTAN|nr:Nucleic acid-binding, OB-fold [Artemisia annua]